MTGRQEVPCPHPRCNGTIHVAADLPSGEYFCLCKAAKVHLSWDQYLQEGRRPRLTLKADS